MGFLAGFRISDFGRCQRPRQVLGVLGGEPSVLSGEASDYVYQGLGSVFSSALGLEDG